MSKALFRELAYIKPKTKFFLSTQLLNGDFLLKDLLLCKSNDRIIQKENFFSYVSRNFFLCHLCCENRTMGIRSEATLC